MENSGNAANGQEYKKMHEEFKELKANYTGLTKDVEALKKGQKEINENYKAINNNFDRINNNMDDLMAKVGKLVEQQDISMVEKVVGKAKEATRAGMLRRPLRRLVVGTISTVMSAADAASEGMAHIRENFEDIVAEAQYNNQKRRVKMTEQPEQ
ncbi:MAG: hypothetical protein VB106_10125 [Clostridiaceae bacterium]|nr:hypothetical protein [Clostridiaceae bacterium]